MLCGLQRLGTFLVFDVFMELLFLSLGYYQSLPVYSPSWGDIFEPDPTGPRSHPAPYTMGTWFLSRG